MTRRWSSAFFLAGLIPAVAQSAGAQVPAAVGVEFQVNTYTTGVQYLPAVAVNDQGRFVIVWASSQDGQFLGIFGRRYDSDGAPLATEFQVNTTTAQSQSYPAVGVEPDGDFAVAWQSSQQDGSGYGIVARRFSSNGAPATAEVMVNAYTSGAQIYPKVAVAPDGGFVVIWQSTGADSSGYGVFGRRFNTAGTALGAEFRANAYTLNHQAHPDVAVEPNGDFVVVWQSQNQDGNLYGVFGQRFNSSGSLAGPEFLVNNVVAGSQVGPGVAVDDDGDFVVVWEGPDGSYAGLFGRRFDSSGAPQAVEFPVNSYTPGIQRAVDLGMDMRGNFLVAWLEQDLGDLFSKFFTVSGLTQVVAPMVNEYTTNGQMPSLAMAADGRSVATWTSTGGQDGSMHGIFARRLTVPLTIDVDGDGQYLPLTDGLLLLRFAFAFTGATLTTGAVGPDCTRCDAASITAYLQSLL